MKYMVQRLESLLFSLLGGALGLKKGPVGPFFLAPSEWSELYRLSICHSVGTLVYGELRTIENNMPANIESVWRAHFDYCLERFDAQVMSLSILGATLDVEGIRMMVLKGFGLALAYPHPELRECADIDIYCFDDFERVNKLVVSSGLCEKTEDTEEKHICFEVSNIEIENHRQFTTEVNRANILIGKALKEMSAEEPILDPKMPGVLFPSATMGALHVLMHSLTHLAWSGIRVRHLCDIAAYFNRYMSDIDIARVRAELREAGLEPASAMLLRLCADNLGLEIDLSDWAGFSKKDLEIAYRRIIHPFEASSSTKNPLLKFSRKIIMFRHRKQLHKIVYGEKFPDSFLDSFAVWKKIRKVF